MNFDKILNLVKKTGDKIVVMSEDGRNDFLIMPLSEYEKMVEGQKIVKDMSEKELLEQVERDIALWRAEHDDEGGDYLLEPEPWDEPWKKSRRELWEENYNRVGDWVGDRTGDRQGYDDLEDEMELDEDELEQDEEKEKNFVAPEYDWEGEKSGISDQESVIREQKLVEPIKYEEIPPPPDVMPRSDSFEEYKNPIIDMGLEDTLEDTDETLSVEANDFASKATDSTDEEKKGGREESGFEEEPVY